MQVFNETIRLEPPVLFSNMMVVTEKTEIGGVEIIPGDLFVLNI